MLDGPPVMGNGDVQRPTNTRTRSFRLGPVAKGAQRTVCGADRVGDHRRSTDRQCATPDCAAVQERSPAAFRTARPDHCPTRITPENNGKIRPQPDRGNAFVKESGGEDWPDVEPSPLQCGTNPWFSWKTKRGKRWDQRDIERRPEVASRNLCLPPSDCPARRYP